jgi:hypothetical protein
MFKAASFLARIIHHLLHFIVDSMMKNVIWDQQSSRSITEGKFDKGLHFLTFLFP